MTATPSLSPSIAVSEPENTMPAIRQMPLLSAVALACAVSISAQAAPGAPDFNSVVLYGDVTIAKDSTASWGVWEEIEPPSAGPAVSLNRIPSSSELYRPVGTVQTPAQAAVPVAAASLCASGALCGFGVMLSATVSGGSYQYLGQQGVVLAPQSVTPNSEANVQAATANWLPAAIALNINTLNGDAIPALTGVGPLPLSGSTYSNTTGDSTFGQDTAIVSTNVGAIKSTFGVDEPVDPVNGFIVQYTQGQTEGQPIAQNSSQFYGVWGMTTSAPDMAALKRGQVIATYSNGNANFWGSTGPIIMQVNFGDSTFAMSANGGVDGKVYVSTPSNGKTVVGGEVGFEATGTLNGSNFSSTRVTAKDATDISGKVVGAFYGSNVGGAGPAVAGGVVDLVKTVAIPTQVNATSAGSVTTYSNAQYVAPFILVRDDLLKANSQK
jgi:hypothetical protein